MSTDTAYSPEQASLTSGFLFTSADASLRTEGLYRDVTTPAASGMSGDFGEDVRAAFRQARADGIEEPLLVGAIPFDTRQPSALFIPEQHQWFDRRRYTRMPTAPLNHHTPDALWFWPKQAEFEAMVSSVVSACQAGQVDKVVLSRVCDLLMEEAPDLEGVLRALMAQHPQAHHFHVPTAEGALIGASPELLVSRQGRRVRALPLAGTARRSPLDGARDQAAAEQLRHSRKDRQEHQWVVDAMRQELQRHCHLLDIPSRPVLLDTPSLWHLATPIAGQLKRTETSSLSLACALHPTPALGGTPRTRALSMIEMLEPFERELFGGMVGWCDAEGNGEWAVTIRCGAWQPTAQRMRLYAGAGLVADSDPCAEWQETGAKLATMLHAFGFTETGDTLNEH